MRFATVGAAGFDKNLIAPTTVGPVTISFARACTLVFPRVKQVVWISACEPSTSFASVISARDRSPFRGELVTLSATAQPGRRVCRIGHRVRSNGRRLKPRLQRVPRMLGAAATNVGEGFSLRPILPALINIWQAGRLPHQNKEPEESVAQASRRREEVCNAYSLQCFGVATSPLAYNSTRRRRRALRNDRHGAEAHRGAGDHRAQQQADKRIEHAGGDRDAERVVDEGEEQVLADVAHGARG